MEDKAIKVKKCGIYVIKNTLNKKIYIGQSSDILRRFANHKYELKNNIHKNKHLQDSWNKYGENYFIFNILYKCPAEELNEKEIYFIKKYNSIENGYNLFEGGEDRENLIKRGKLIASIRKELLGKCKICKKETENPYSYFCNNHNGLCKKCGQRFKKEKKGIDLP